MLGWILAKFEEFLSKSSDVQETPLCDFSRLHFEVRPCDVILVEGRTRISNMIKAITLSRWTHAVLFIGRLSDIEDEESENNKKE